MRRQTPTVVDACITATEFRMPLPNGYSRDKTGYVHGPADTDVSDKYLRWLLERTIEIRQLEKLEAIRKWVKFFGILTVICLVIYLFALILR